mmetsp:Transcript_48675/g.152813  ORF Transcript_48675/g.152813 Transcript_48675/m.152813 type:complete len:228 (-) Transcript_48675:305-988(-)
MQILCNFHRLLHERVLLHFEKSHTAGLDACFIVDCAVEALKVLGERSTLLTHRLDEVGHVCAVESVGLLVLDRLGEQGHPCDATSSSQGFRVCLIDSTEERNSCSLVELHLTILQRLFSLIPDEGDPGDGIHHWALGTCLRGEFPSLHLVHSLLELQHGVVVQLIHLDVGVADAHHVELIQDQVEDNSSVTLRPVAQVLAREQLDNLLEAQLANDAAVNGERPEPLP